MTEMLEPDIEAEPPSEPDDVVRVVRRARSRRRDRRWSIVGWSMFALGAVLVVIGAVGLLVLL